VEAVLDAYNDLSLTTAGGLDMRVGVAGGKLPYWRATLRQGHLLQKLSPSPAQWYSGFRTFA